jgi:hypothetical protein
MSLDERGFDQWSTEVRLAAAAILDQEREQLPCPFEIDGIDHRAALLARRDELRARTVSCEDMVLCGTVSFRAMSPAAMPEGPVRTSRRNTLSRLS